MPCLNRSVAYMVKKKRKKERKSVKAGVRCSQPERYLWMGLNLNTWERMHRNHKGTSQSVSHRCPYLLSKLNAFGCSGFAAKGIDKSDNLVICPGTIKSLWFPMDTSETWKKTKHQLLLKFMKSEIVSLFFVLNCSVSVKISVFAQYNAIVLAFDGLEFYTTTFFLKHRKTTNLWE